MTSSTSVGRGRLRARRAVLCLTTILASCGAAAPALAQNQPYRQLDENGIDLATGEVIMAFKEASVGSGPAELAIIRRNGNDRNSSQFDGISFTRGNYGNVIVIGRDDRTFDAFDKVGGQYVARKGNGAVIGGAGGDYTYTAPDGTAIRFVNPANSPELCDNSSTQYSCTLVPYTITSPDGGVVTMNYEAGYYTVFDPSDPNPPTQSVLRLRGVNNSYGYSFDYSYASDETYPDAPPPDAWHVRTGATLRRSGAVVSSVGYAYPGSDLADVTDPAGATWRVSSIALRRPGETGNSYLRNGTQDSFTVTKDGIVTTYARNVSGTTATMTVTNALSQTSTIVSNLTTGRPTSVTDGLNKTTTYSYDGYGRLTRVTAPEQNYFNYTLDARGNKTETRIVAKPGPAIADIVSSAVYPASCNPKTCNQPISTTDALGRTTDYAYDQTHGGVTRVERPALSAGAPRSTVTYGYTQIAGEYRLTSASTCTTTATCAGSANEIVSTASYDTSGNLTATTTGAGDGSVTATTGYSYTPAGDVASVDGPLPGSGDTSYYAYDGARRPTGVFGPDPDGSGPRQRRASRVLYDASGRAVSRAQGYADASYNFTAVDEVISTWSGDRKLSDAGTARGVVQYSYYPTGRLQCTVQRMNLNPLSSQPANACTLGTPGSDGPDRLSIAYYDAAGRVSATQSAVYTSDQSTDTQASYTDNGRLQTLTDANGNRTTYAYDQFDRLQRTYYPVTTVGAGTSSTSDYEELGYDANGNVTSRRLRDGYALGYGYDALDRLTSMTTSHLTTDDSDVTYEYDFADRLKKAAKNAANQTSFTYDALGRRTSESNYYYGLASQYDAAGRRTRLTWNDGFYVTYDYDPAGQMTVIRENGAGPLATFGYDDAGRRTSLTHGDGSVTSYGYDGASRLGSQGLDLVGTASDLTLTFGYNPASQIASVTRSTDAYAYSYAGTNGNVAETRDGLNRLTYQGSTPVSYDNRGNTIAVGGQGYVYSTTGRLAVAPQSGVSLYADSLERLDYISSENLLIGHDGDMATSEHTYNGTTNPIARRYIYGPGADEPVAMYEGAGIDDSTRRYLHADERGSIVAVTGTYGNLVGINKYDEYGVPASGNIGRFQYTGQAWLPSLGMYYYKARMYAPQLGRFMQTDPIGYDAGMNLYAYVGGDAVNNTDPSGTCRDIPGSRIKDCSADNAARAFVDNLTGLDDNEAKGAVRAITSYLEGNIELDGVFNFFQTRTSYYNIPTYMDGEDIVVTAPQQIYDSEKYFISGGRYILNPNYQDPVPWLNLENIVKLEVSAFSAAEVVVTTPAVGIALFSRGTGLLNSNNVLRVGWGWKGSASAGRDVFRMSLGHKSWQPIPGLPTFPWHIP